MCACKGHKVVPRREFPGCFLPLSTLSQPPRRPNFPHDTEAPLCSKRANDFTMNNHGISLIRESLQLRVSSISTIEKDPLLIIDAANVVGSVPNGWWRNRFAAAIRLRDSLRSLHAIGLRRLKPPVDVLLVTEGDACGVGSSEFVAVVGAWGSGDDEIVRQARAASGRNVVVVTSDVELQERISALGATYIGSGRFTRILEEFSQGDLSYSFRGNLD